MSKISGAFLCIVLILGFVLASNNFSYANEQDEPVPKAVVVPVEPPPEGGVDDQEIGLPEDAPVTTNEGDFIYDNDAVRCASLCAGGIPVSTFPDCEGKEVFPGSNIYYGIEFGDCCCHYHFDPNETDVHELPRKG